VHDDREVLSERMSHEMGEVEPELMFDETVSRADEVLSLREVGCRLRRVSKSIIILIDIVVYIVL